MERQRHYVNPKETGISVFITTTVLDFVHVFARAEPKTRMATEILRESRRMQAALYGYVVMPHHIHLLLRLSDSMNAAAFMERFKRRSSAQVLPTLTQAEIASFDQQRGLNGNTFWQRSFRAKRIDREGLFLQKLKYIHDNPVRAGYVEKAEDYAWSSARLYLEGRWEGESGVDYTFAMESLRVLSCGDRTIEEGEP